MTPKDKGFCPECGIGLNNSEIRLRFCQNCKAHWDEDEDDFEECDECDGHDACRDFGCEEKLKAALAVSDRGIIKPRIMESVPENCIEYLIKSFEEAATVHGKIKRVSNYGGSAFVIFEDDICYRLNFQNYNNEVAGYWDEITV